MTRLAALTLLALAGCPRPVCPTLSTRCDGARAEVCAADGQWQLVEDCDVVETQSGGEWACAPVVDEGEAMHACVQENFHGEETSPGEEKSEACFPRGER